MWYIPQEELARRREIVAQKLPEGSVLVLLSTEVQYRNADVEHTFRQASDFWYVTGLNTPESVFAMKKDLQGKVHTIVYKQPKDPDAEVWTGRRLDGEEVKKITGIEDVRDFSQFESDWHELFQGITQVYVDIGGESYTRLRHRLNMFLTKVERRSVAKHIEAIKRTSALLDKIRLYKSDWEIQQMREAAQISMDAHRRLAALIPHNKAEYTLEGEFLAEIRSQRADWAYLPIVASGNNACTLHYMENMDQFSSQTLLVDAGAEYNYYAADITRIYPGNTTFTSPQKRIYELVLEAQEHALAEAHKPDQSLADIHYTASYVLAEGLVELGVLSGPVHDILANGEEKQYFPHGIGHYIGLDVHDVGPYLSITGERSKRTLDEGMAITIEPGLYFKHGDPNVPEEFQGIGVRIEDDIVKTHDGIENLTSDLAKTVDEVEDLVQGKGDL